jgi:hypothetical protein
MAPLFCVSEECPQPHISPLETARLCAAVVAGIKRILPYTAGNSSPGHRRFRSFRVSRSGGCNEGCRGRRASRRFAGGIGNLGACA